MKVSLFALFMLLFLNFHLSAQTYGNKGVLDFSFNYIESVSNNNSTFSQFKSETNSLDFGLSYGFCFNNHFTWGFGINYGHIKENDLNTIFLMDFNEDHDYFGKEALEIKSNIIAPLLYFKYNKQLFNKLYLSTRLTVSYGFVESKSECFNYHSDGSLYFTPVSTSSSMVTTINDTKKSQYLGITLQPELCYFLTNRLGFIVKLGGVGFTDFEGQDQHWTLSMNPSYWSYGLILSIGKKSVDPLSEL